MFPISFRQDSSFLVGSFKFPENLCPFHTDHNQFGSAMMWSLEGKIILPSPY